MTQLQIRLVSSLIANFTGKFKDVHALLNPAQRIGQERMNIQRYALVVHLYMGTRVASSKSKEDDQE